MTAPTISVVIPHYRDLEGLDLCLQGLERQTMPRDRFEIIVADNGSPEGEAAVADAVAGRARLVCVSQKGAGPARNGGAAVARGQVLAFTDADCRPAPQWLEAGLAALDQADLVGGAMQVLVDDRAAMSGPEAFETVFAFDNAAYVQRKGFSVTANLFCRRAVFEAVGGFRTGVSEDLEWSHRATGAGYRLGYAAEALVGHPARRTWSELRAKWRRLNAETFGLYLDLPGGRGRWLVRSLVLPLSALAHTPKVLGSPRLESLRDRVAALKVLYRLRLWRCADAVRLLAGERG